MRLVVNGRHLDVVDHRSATLADLLDLQAGTRRWRPGGFRQGALEDLARSSGRPGFVDSVEGDQWIAVVLFLTRRAAGDAGRFEELVDCRVSWVVEPGDDEPAAPDLLPAGPATTGARFPGDTRVRRRPASGSAGSAAGHVDWPFDDVAQSLAEWLLPVGMHWPGITPLTVYQLPAHWWARYVLAARSIAEQDKRSREKIR